jgi:hypothetical protein
LNPPKELHIQGGGMFGLCRFSCTYHTLFATAKLSPLLSTDSSASVRTSSDKLRTNFLDPQIAFRIMVVWWRSFNIFLILKWKGRAVI